MFFKAKPCQLDESAYEALNMVRRRAYKQDINSPSSWDLQVGLSPEEFLDTLVWERAWEFCAEYEGRWFTLQRLELVEKLPQYRIYDQPGFPHGAITKDIYFAPIPKEDIWLNTGLE